MLMQAGLLILVVVINSNSAINVLASQMMLLPAMLNRVGFSFPLDKPQPPVTEPYSVIARAK
jgi:hypothetical protein